MRLRDVVRLAYQDPSAARRPQHRGFFDGRDRIRLSVFAGKRIAMKRRRHKAAESERRLAAAAQSAFANLVVPGIGAVEVIVPEIVGLDHSDSVLVTPFLGKPLSDDLNGARHAVPEHALRILLESLLSRGVDAPGCVPRNLFPTATGLAIIDWEDARLAPGPIRPSLLSLMKWDIAWSDVFRRDIGLRSRLAVAPPSEEPPLDEWEAVLASWSAPSVSVQDLRVRGVEATLASELYVAECSRHSAAELGHLAEDVLTPRLGVFHTLLTGRVRQEQGGPAYGAVLAKLGSIADGLLTGAVGVLPTRHAWAVTSISEAERLLDTLPGHDESGVRSLEEAAARLEQLRGTAGWSAGCERAWLAESILHRVAKLVTSTLGTPVLDVLLRGSCAQGVLTRSSDVDFEVSSPAWPQGHHAVEALIVDILDCFGLPAEASDGRPDETDIVGEDPAVTRDLHEWMELRRPGAPQHDPGWVADALPAPDQHLLQRASQYERRGRSVTAKFLWFEARVALARVVFAMRGVVRPPVTLPEQLRRLPDLAPARAAVELEAIVQEAFTLRDSPDLDQHRCEQLAERLARFRQRIDLPGPR